MVSSRVATWLTIAIAACGGSTVSNNDIDAGDPDASIPPDSTPAPSEGGTDSSDATPAEIELRFNCARDERIDLEWNAVPGADHYVIEFNGELLTEVTEPRARARRNGFTPITIRALQGSRELAQRPVHTAGDIWTGDVLYLRGRRGDTTTVESLGCISQRERDAAETKLSLEVNPPTFPLGADRLQRSAVLVDGERSAEDTRRLVYLGGARAFSVEPVRAFLNFSHFEQAIHHDLGAVDDRAGIARTAAHSFAADEAGNVLMGSGYTAPILAIPASMIAGEIRGLAAFDTGLWVLTTNAASASGGTLLHFPGAEPSTTPDRTITLPDPTANPHYVFDGTGSIVANTAGTGHLFRLAGEPGDESWIDTGVVVDKLLSLLSSAQYTFATGGATGNRITVFDRSSLQLRGVYAFDSVDELEVMGFAEPYMRPSQ